MAALPEKVKKAWEDREGPIILSTVNGDGIPNVIYATCVSKFSEDTIVVANNYFSKTLENILAGSKGSILFITKKENPIRLREVLNTTKEVVFLRI